MVSGKTCGVLMVNTTVFELVPPALTVMLAVPAVAIRLVGTIAVTCVPLTNVVGSAALFQLTVAPLTNPVPVTVRVKPLPPAVTEFGERLEITREGEVETALIVKMAAPEKAPPGF